MATLRLAELLAPLSLVSDLGMGQPPEDAMRTCLLATRLASALDLEAALVGDVYWAALLQHVRSALVRANIEKVFALCARPHQFPLAMQDRALLTCSHRLFAGAPSQAEIP